MAKVEELKKLRSHLLAHPEQHDQDSWVGGDYTWDYPGETIRVGCGTTACAAGWTVILAGDKITSYYSVLSTKDHPESYPWIEDSHVYHRSIKGRAREILGLTSIQSEQLFIVADTLEDVVHVIDTIIEEEMANV